MSHPRQMVAFAAVGTVGFLVDAGMLTLLSSGFGADVYLSRAFSFTSAVLVTWLLNRSLVFKIRPRPPREKGRELGSYFIVQTGGALLNLATFAALIWLFPGLRAIPVLPLAAGAVLGLVFNFSGSRAWVFE
jgi:putative flippase GtrA